ncbi:MAG: TonB-dependent receptor plug domain-containing protein, partial [Gammaproteobacteria bacterium]|nr:TonB-dependent receptor plug domain-containing protein [Gemmatimonadota bacterium]NIR38918.1 TonB-dependent receptor plug domain-containing protein [Actinomycetota bacterium]NIU76963.1 TonB-dependent receptor plug domain-containing protein [Gammaproteobacteria bacterium]NIY10648.1 TonB-dependent receptor plug domain-containing protein [Gemmatimonadota bacterium]
ERRGTGVQVSDGATVVSAAELHDSHGSVLRAIMGKVPNMKVNFVGLDRCPAIALRSFEEIHGNNFPDIYLDGTRANNTCILESVRAEDLDRVEIYPQGFTRRPGYGTSTHGLILLFSRRSG